VIAGRLLLVLLAADPTPEPQAIFLAASVRVHLRASEELDPDYLRALARQNVTLWLTTRTNTLRASTLETINSFGVAWIALRAPVGDAEARQLGKVPRAGLWLDVKDLDGARRVLGPRRLALELRGPLDAALFGKIQKTRPAETIWRAPAEVDLLSWGLFRQLPGRKVLVRTHLEPWPTDCPNPSDGEPALQTHLDAVSKAPRPGFPCGRGPRVEVPLEVDRAELQRLLVREPSTELVIDIADDPRLVSKARRLLDDLGLK
jgi:hypothetical protein